MDVAAPPKFQLSEQQYVNIFKRYILAKGGRTK